MKTVAKRSQNDPRPTPQRSQMDRKPIPDRPQNYFKVTPKLSQTDSKMALDRSLIEPKPIPDRPQTDPELTTNDLSPTGKQFQSDPKTCEPVLAASCVDPK